MYDNRKPYIVRHKSLKTDYQYIQFGQILNAKNIVDGIPGARRLSGSVIMLSDKELTIAILKFGQFVTFESGDYYSNRFNI